MDLTSNMEYFTVNNPLWQFFLMTINEEVLRKENFDNEIRVQIFNPIDKIPF